MGSPASDAPRERRSALSRRQNFLCGLGGRRVSLDEVIVAADSTALLREFAEHRSETAFAALVRRYVDLVYSVGLRRCAGRTALAEEVCQLVFIDLARKAHALPAELSVAGWLHQHACFVAAKQLRTENRRQRREEIALQLRTLADETDWSRLGPLLDDALLELSPADRDSLVLRYLQQCPLAEVGARLGLSENAARMRVDRALDKLRATLAKRGVTSTSAALAMALTGPAVTAAPASLASTVTAAVIAATVTATAPFGFFSFMASTKLKAAAVTALLATAGTALLLQHQTGDRLRAENAELQRRVAQLNEAAQATRQSDGLKAEELARLRQGQAELLRLRGEVARLRAQSPAPPPTAAPVTEAPTEEPAIADRGTDTPENTSSSFVWAVTAQQKDRFIELVKFPDDIPTAEASKHYDDLFRRMTNTYGRWQFGDVQRIRRSDDGTVKLDLGFRDPDTGRQDALLIFLREYESGWRVVIDDVPRGDPPLAENSP